MDVLNKSYGSKDRDGKFDACAGLTWYPWVGDSYDNENSLKLLVVGESHYINGDENTSNLVNGEVVARDEWRDYTRATVREAFVNNEWRTPMHTNTHKLFHGDQKFDKERFWSESSYYNLVQRLMDYKRKERPSADDFVQGWKTFLTVVETLKPTHCVVIGTSAAHYFNRVMHAAGVDYDGVEKLKKVGRYLPRRARLLDGDQELTIHFVKHASKYFSWSGWRNHLGSDAPELMDSIQSRSFTIN
ncbi:hypothetical protein Rhal01_01171 [Rubritalea halochordaticola]|uniref:Uracil-DNA glycosylase-like domain-containing protein n=1 Tax=Rubritalea halochordaticola TaxID=714537 RepID=A0ABP9V130_9BACT